MKSTLFESELDVRNLVVIRGTKTVVNNINLKIRPTSITALMGANGAGKTSTVLALSGVIESAFGEILLDEKNIKGLATDVIRRLGLASVPEGHQVLRELSVLDNLRAAGGDLSDSELGQAIKDQLFIFPEIEAHLHLLAGNLSGGQQQMLAIAQALIVAPKFLLIDELSFGLSPAIVMRLVPIIRRIAASGVGVLLIEQFTTIALALADHVYVMSRGMLTYSGSPTNLRDDPQILQQAYFPIDSAEEVLV
jgi:branched-chain amino acid transport system ATP-binding protein